MAKHEAIMVTAFRSPDVFQMGDRMKVFVAPNRTKKACDLTVHQAETYFKELVMEGVRRQFPKATQDEYAQDLVDAISDGYWDEDGWVVVMIWPQVEMVNMKRVPKCQRCGSPLRGKNNLCSDETCPFSDHDQMCPMGWLGHPDHPGVYEETGCIDVCPAQRK